MTINEFLKLFPGMRSCFREGYDDLSLYVAIDYTDHRGVRSWRVVRPLELRYDECDTEPGEQWLLDAYDPLAEQVRTFALAGIHEWRRPQL